METVSKLLVITFLIKLYALTDIFKIFNDREFLWENRCVGLTHAKNQRKQVITFVDLRDLVWPEVYLSSYDIVT